jgi:hypothetical protein
VLTYCSISAKLYNNAKAMPKQILYWNIRWMLALQVQMWCHVSLWGRFQLAHALHVKKALAL